MPAGSTEASIRRLAKPESKPVNQKVKKKQNKTHVRILLHVEKVIYLGEYAQATQTARH